MYLSVSEIVYYKMVSYIQGEIITTYIIDYNYNVTLVLS